jgi:hypothetical protein
MPCVDGVTDADTHTTIHTGRIRRGECDGCDSPSCPTCVTCERCDGRFPFRRTVLTTGGATICESCRDRWYWQCERCDGWSRDGYDCGDGCCGEYCECEDCTDSGDYGPLVHDYSYKPRPVFHGTGPVFLGPEIEVEAPYRSQHQCAELAVSHLGDLGYLKEDGSLEHGFEIVTHPMSYSWAMAHFPWELLTELDNMGCAATDATGLHVHISRAGFASPCHAYRWMKFIYRNQRGVEAVARRSSSYAAFTTDDRLAVKHYAKGGTAANRYRAVNTNNTDTFELRVFASSLDPNEVKAALAFTAATVEYTRELSVAAIAHRAGWSWPAFTTWVSQQPIYQPLTDHLEASACAY